jgi:hypothetical protein
MRRIEPVTPARLRLRNPGDKVQKLTRLLDVASTAGGNGDGGDVLYEALVSEWPDPSALTFGAPEPSTFADTGDDLVSHGVVGHMMLRDQLGVLPDGMLEGRPGERRRAVPPAAARPSRSARLIAPLAWQLRRAGEQLDRCSTVRAPVIDRPKTGFDPPSASNAPAWRVGGLLDRAPGGPGLARPRRPSKQRWWARSARRNWDYLWTVLQFQAWLEATTAKGAVTTAAAIACWALIAIGVPRRSEGCGRRSWT